MEVSKVSKGEAFKKWLFSFKPLQLVFLVGALIGTIMATTGDKTYDHRNYLLLLSAIILVMVNYYRLLDKNK